MYFSNPKETDGEPLSMGSSYADSLAFTANSDEVVHIYAFKK